MTPELLQDIIQWDVKNWSDALIFGDKHLQTHTKGKKLRCLEIGARQGGLSLWLAMKGHDVVCSDIRYTQAQAYATHQKYTFPGTVTYEDINALSIPYTNAFDIIIFKSVLGGISCDKELTLQTTAIQQMHKALAPGGKLFFAENLKATVFHKLMRYFFIPHSNLWRYINLKEMEELLRPFAKKEMKTAGVLGVLGRRPMFRNIFSGLDHAIMNKVCPNRWQYITYGIAEK